MDSDPLLPQLDVVLDIPSGLSGEERLRAIHDALVDHMSFGAMAWPAADASGALVPPPPEHVLDHLARTNGLVDDERAAVTMAANTVCVLAALPECDFCNQSARYDGSVEGEGRKVGAFLCLDDYRERGSGTLGASGDVFLMLMGEVPENVQDECNALCVGLGRDPLFN